MLCHLTLFHLERVRSVFVVFTFVLTPSDLLHVFLHEVVILILAGPWLISTIFWIYVKLHFSIYPVIGFISHIVHRNLVSSS